MKEITVFQRKGRGAARGYVQLANKLNHFFQQVWVQLKSNLNLKPSSPSINPLNVSPEP